MDHITIPEGREIYKNMMDTDFREDLYFQCILGVSRNPLDQRKCGKMLMSRQLKSIQNYSVGGMLTKQATVSKISIGYQYQEILLTDCEHILLGETYQERLVIFLRRSNCCSCKWQRQNQYIKYRVYSLMDNDEKSCNDSNASSVRVNAKHNFVQQTTNHTFY